MKENVIVGITGHRNFAHPYQKIKTITRDGLISLQADVVITGMALGFDLLVAEICVEEGIPFVAAMPCKGQAGAWSDEQKERWRSLMGKAYKRKVVSPGKFEIWKLFERNKWIVKRSNTMLCYWSGEERGGTYHCLSNAKELKLPILNVYNRC